MAVIKQLATYSGEKWNKYDIGVNANNINCDALSGNSIIGINENKQLISLPSEDYPTLNQFKYLKGIESNVQTQINNINNKIDNNEWIAQTEGPYNLDDYITVGRYVFNLSRRDYLSNAPGVNAVNGWLEVLPMPNLELDDTNRILVKQIWHRFGSTATSGTVGRSNYGEASYTDEYVRIYDSLNTQNPWTPWARSVFVQENNSSYSIPRSQIHYKLIKIDSLPISGNYTTLEISSTSNSSIFNSDYKIEGYSPFCLCSINWSQGHHYVHMQAYEITNDKFWASFTNTGEAVTITNIKLGFMYVKDGTLWKPHN